MEQVGKILAQLVFCDIVGNDKVSPSALALISEVESLPAASLAANTNKCPKYRESHHVPLPFCS